MRHDMVQCGQVEKIKRRGLAMNDRVTSVKGKLKDSGVMDHRGIEARVEGLMLMDQVQR